MHKRLALVLLMPTLAFAQEPVAPAPAPQVVHAAVPVVPDWNVGAGIGFMVAGPSYSTIGLGGAGGLAGLAGVGSASSGMSLLPQPRFTVLVERRLSDQLFLTFQGSASYSASQDDKNAELKGHYLALDGAIGLRRVFNPRGVIEVSWFGNVGVGYTNSESRTLGPVYDPATGSYSQTMLAKYRNHTFGVGAVTGLTLERTLIDGLALRLSSGIVGLNYGLGASTVTTPMEKTDRQHSQFDVGLRFSPSIELRYAF
ncbi:MAG: hypothetical protein Q8L48_33795 [Archangium sp.]|nr:hypothetical protein [Archangium sp.]